MDGSKVKPETTCRESNDMAARSGSGSQPAVGGVLWRETFSSQNVLAALGQVEANKGAPGPDGMTVEELRPWLKSHWRDVRRRLDDGMYRPGPVRRVTISKPGGGFRLLGVPDVLDRLICQCVARTLSELFDPGFSESSYGFRPGRSAHDAVLAAKGYIADGYLFGVALDLDSFFDRVQHDVLMARVARKVDDKALLRLIGRYLRAGVMDGGICMASTVGTPQGSPLSPILSNIILDDLDRELEGRGHRFVRYADDIHIYVGSRRAAERVMASTADYVERRLKLVVNRDKSKVDEAKNLTLLGFRFFLPGGQVKIRVSPESWKRLKDKLRFLTGRARGVSMWRRIGEINRLIIGWVGYYGLAETPYPFKDTDGWLRRRLRQVRWREWKRFAARRRNLLAAETLTAEQATRCAASSRSAWRIAHTAPLQIALPNDYWRDLGLACLEDERTRCQARITNRRMRTRTYGGVGGAR